MKMNFRKKVRLMHENGTLEKVRLKHENGIFSSCWIFTFKFHAKLFLREWILDIYRRKAAIELQVFCRHHHAVAEYRSLWCLPSLQQQPEHMPRKFSREKWKWTRSSRFSVTVENFTFCWVYSEELLSEFLYMRSRWNERFFSTKFFLSWLVGVPKHTKEFVLPVQWDVLGGA